MGGCRCLIKEAVIGFFSRQDGVVLDAGLIDLVDDEFRKAPPAISIGRMMHVDCWIGWDLVMCAPIFLAMRL